MRLNFNVLWVDDQPDRVDAQIKGIANHMEVEGFAFVPTKCQSIDQVMLSLSDDVFTDEIDLILVDWDLGANQRGQDAIAEIRKYARYKDVVFYSAQENPERLRKLAYEANLEGVFCASREDLVQEVIGVFESLIKKVLDLDHTRGIVMGATSDIDFMVTECLVKVHSRLDEIAQNAMLADALALVKKNLASSGERAKTLENATTMRQLFEAHLIFTANDRLRILSRELKKDAFKEHAALRPSVITYISEIVPKRNDLGHIVLVPEGKPTAVVDETGKHVSLVEMREFRRKLLRLRGDFRSLLAAL